MSVNIYRDTLQDLHNTPSQLKSLLTGNYILEVRQMDMTLSWVV